jgi:hypothetical protein
MGLQPQVRDAMACNELRSARAISCTRVRNIVATIGPREGRHLLLNAHYDSSVAGPGAGDDGIGVATLLEVASLLRNQSLRRPVTLLFNEGEEVGLIGARAFLQRDPLAGSVHSLINLEARGTTGPVNMFETSLPNGAPIAAYSRAVERPVASSLATDLYRQLPNSTDVNIFAERGWTTLNLAMTGNETRYHSPGDNLAALDLRSLQHMGDQTLSLTRELALGVPELRGQRIFMDLLGLELISLPQSLGLAILGLLLIGFAVVGWRRRSVGRPLLTLVAALLLGTAIAWAGEALVGMLRPGMFWRAYPLWLHLAVYGSMAAAVLFILGTIGRRIEAERLRIAYWLLFLLVGVAVAFVATGGIIYFLLPPVPVLAAALAGRSMRQAERLAALASAALLFLTFGVMLAQVEELLNHGPMWLFAPLGGLLIMPVLIEAQPLIASVRRAGLAIGSALLLIAGWSAASAAPAYSADRQQRFSVEYVRGADGRSWWAIANDGVPLAPAYGGGWKRTEVPYSISKRWIRPAPKLPDILPPTATVLWTAAAGDRRRVRLRLQANGADSIAVVMPKDARILAGGAPGSVRRMPAGKSEDEYAVRCTGRSCDGLALDLLIAKKQPVNAKLIGTRFGLPAQGRPLVAARPRNAQPQYSTDSIVTIGRSRF